MTPEMIAFSSNAVVLLADPGALAVHERRPHAELHTVATRDLDRPQRHHLRARRRHLEHLLVGDLVELERVRDDPRVGGEDARHVREDLAGVGAERRRERDRRRVGAAAAERRHVVRRRRDALEAGDEHDLVLGECLVDPCARTSTIFAFVCVPSVTMPACEPVNETASWPRSWIAIAQSAFEMRSPVETSMSYSRGCGCGRDLVGEPDQLVGRLAHRREDADDLRARPRGRRRGARRRASACRCRRRRCRRTSSRRGPASARALPTAGTASKSIVVILRQCRHVHCARPATLREWVVLAFARDRHRPAAVGDLAVGSLSPHHEAQRWDIAWSGFDTGLAIAFCCTAFAAWRRSPWVGALRRRDRDAAPDRRLVRRPAREPRRRAARLDHARRSSRSCRSPRSASGSPTARSGSSRDRRRGRSHLAAAGERAAESDLVGVLEVAADREPAREPGDADATA